MSDALQDKALELDPDDDAETKARELTPELRLQAEEAERKRREIGGPAVEPPDHVSDDVREHERDMANRGFEKGQGPR